MSVRLDLYECPQFKTEDIMRALTSNVSITTRHQCGPHDEFSGGADKDDKGVVTVAYNTVRQVGFLDERSSAYLLDQVGDNMSELETCLVHARFAISSGALVMTALRGMCSFSFA